MRKFALLFISISMLAVACKKDEQGDNITPTIEPPIVTTVKFPALVLSPVDSFAAQTSGCGDVVPFPTDSVSSLRIDIDSDGADDFEFQFQNKYEFVSASSPCANYQTDVTIKGLADENGVVCVERSDWANYGVTPLDEGQQIGDELVFYNETSIYRRTPTDHYTSFNAENYIGVRISGGHYGWVKVSFVPEEYKLIISEYAYNSSAGYSISAGKSE